MVGVLACMVVALLMLAPYGVAAPGWTAARAIGIVDVLDQYGLMYGLDTDSDHVVFTDSHSGLVRV